MGDDDLIPVMLTVRPQDGVVAVMPLLETPIGTAIYEGDTYKVIGQVREAKWEDRHPRTGVTVTRKGYRWYYDEEEFGRESGTALTKKAAVAAVLLAGGYREAPPNAANQGLF